MPHGVPLHTRSITVKLLWAGNGEAVVEGRLIDLRKRAVLPLGGTLRGPGVVHDMSVRLRIQVDGLRILAVEPLMSSFPYGGSEQTGGESCPGRIADVQSVVGLELERRYGEELAQRIGGPRGCFHIFTLLRLMGPAVHAALSDQRLRGRLEDDGSLHAGDVLWSRSITVDGLQTEGLNLAIHGTLTDLFQNGRPHGGGEERVSEGSEAMLRMVTGLPEMVLMEVSGRTRTLGSEIFEASDWNSEPGLERLKNLNVRKGFSARVQQLLNDLEGLLPTSHLVFMSAPVVMQCMPSLLGEVAFRGGGGGGGSTGTAPDSCHMWRSGGPLQRTVEEARRNRASG